MVRKGFEPVCWFSCCCLPPALCKLYSQRSNPDACAGSNAQYRFSGRFPNCNRNADKCDLRPTSDLYQCQYGLPRALLEAERHEDNSGGFDPGADLLFHESVSTNGGALLTVRRCWHKVFAQAAPHPASSCPGLAGWPQPCLTGLPPSRQTLRFAVSSRHCNSKLGSRRDQITNAKPTLHSLPTLVSVCSCSKRSD